jgi:hypothetical protein
MKQMLTCRIDDLRLPLLIGIATLRLSYGLTTDLDNS